MVKAPSITNSVGCLEQLRNWVSRANGALIGPVRVETLKDERNERCLKATREVASDEVIVRIPSAYLISGKFARSRKNVEAVLQRAAQEGLNKSLPNACSDSAAILLYLMAELSLGEQSFWKPWFDSLPTTFITPLTVDEEVVASTLSGTPALALIEQLRAELHELYTTWFVPYAVHGSDGVYDERVCGWERFLWAHNVMESRSFLVDGDTMLAPFADMANHAVRGSAACNARVRGWTTTDATDEIGLEVVATRPVNADDEICISYGGLANWELLAHFGFAICDNPDDALIVQVDPDINDEGDNDNDVQIDMRRLLVLHVHVPNFDNGFALTCKNPLPIELVTAARILFASAEELDNGVRKDYTSLISTRNERAVLDWLRKVIDGLTPVEEDDDDDDLSISNDSNIKSFLHFCRIYVESIRSIVSKAESAVDDLETTISQHNT